MRLTVHLDGQNLRNWHLRLLARLAARSDLDVRVGLSDLGARSSENALPPNTEMLFRIERRIHGIAPGGLAAAAPLSALEPYRCDGDPADLVLDIAGDFDPKDGRSWTLTFNGSPGEGALFSLLVAGQVPVATIQEGDKAIAVSRLGTEYQGVALASFEDGLARTITLILAAISGAASNKLPTLPADARFCRDFKSASASAMRTKAAKELAYWVVRALYRLRYHSPHWRVGWRKLDGPDLIDLGCHPATGWHNLPDDGARFYADPFPIQRQNQVTLFVEEYPHETGKGIISAVAFGPDGPIGRPEPVLELPYHLSYPFVFECEGQTWMIPESCAAGTIDLFRATRFPGGWVKEATLVSSVVASDATLLNHEGRWWLFATVRDEGGAFSDSLHLWSADNFRGPWFPHPRNPVLIDIASARPAGRIVCRNGQLVRPVQDCRAGYGNALGIAHILQLNDLGFQQSVKTILTAGPAWPGRRIHTLNSAGGFEFIDGSGRGIRALFRKSSRQG